MPRDIKGRALGKEGGQMAQTPVGRDRVTNREVRTETGGDKGLKKLPGTGWGDLERSRILERCGAELRQLENYMASEHIALPGSSNVVALSYSGRDDDVRREAVKRDRGQDGTHPVTGRGRLRMG